MKLKPKKIVNALNLYCPEIVEEVTENLTTYEEEDDVDVCIVNFESEINFLEDYGIKIEEVKLLLELTVKHFDLLYYGHEGVEDFSDFVDSYLDLEARGIDYMNLVDIIINRIYTTYPFYTEKYYLPIGWIDNHLLIIFF